MDWNRTDRMSDDDFTSPSSVECSGVHIPLASRRSGFARVLAQLLTDSQPAILITGEGGAGKTWLWTQVVESLPVTWHSVTVDLTSSLSPSEFLLLVGAGFGLNSSPNLGASRLELASALRDEAADGRSWILILEDAHCATPEVWEEIRVLSSRLGQAGNFAALIIVAQTELIRKLAGRGLASIGGRITEHVHLLPLDLDECRALVQESAAQSHIRTQSSSLEEIHRDARGNSGEILRLVQRSAGRARRESTEMLPFDLETTSLKDPSPELIEVDSTPPSARREVESHPSSILAPSGRSNPSIVPNARMATRPSLPLVPSRPPLRLEEGLIEVGWEDKGLAQSGDTEDDENDPDPLLSNLGWGDGERPRSTSLDSSSAAKVAFVVSIDEEAEDAEDAEDADSEPAEEWVDDPYAALQAWSEWARNHERASEQPFEPVGSSQYVDTDLDSEASATAQESSSSAQNATEAGVGVKIRAESQHEHAPYGQLFSEVRKSKQP